MTADIAEACTAGTHSESATSASTNTQNTEDLSAGPYSYAQHREIEHIFEFLSFNPQIIFKSQQIDDPELLRNEKVQIARDIYHKSPQTFLLRFGNYLEEKHLTTFEEIVIPLNQHGDEMELLIADYRNKLHTRKRDVKNRRYAAMQKLIAEGEYFSEQEMMKRAPELYQELIGQYLSESEKKQRDRYDVKNTTFSGILIHTMEQQQLQDVLKLADKENVKSRQLERQLERNISNEDEATQSTQLDSEEESMMENESVTTDDDIPNGFRQQWGNFDNEQVPCSNSNQGKKKAKEKPKSKEMVRVNGKLQADTFITAGERELLRQEFIGIMHEQFLSGGDHEFDYTQIDDNTQLDDLIQLNQDKEDAYFEESDYSNDGVIIRDLDRSFDDESEDELDVFMNHLNRHHSLQQQ